MDRQHFRGPLWDGIKPKSVMDDPNVLLYKPPKDSEKLPDVDGKKEWEYIDR
jgi:hypothetical protein